MASLYEEPDWSTKLETLKDNIVRILAEGKVSWSQMGKKLAKYYTEKDNFSLTDVWAALVVSNMVKEVRIIYTSRHTPIQIQTNHRTQFQKIIRNLKVLIFHL